MIADKSLRSELTVEQQRVVYEKVSKDCLKFLLDNFVDIIDDDCRTTPIVSSALMKIVLEFCLHIAPNKLLGFALLHQVLGQVSISQVKADMAQKIAEYEGLFTEEQREKLEKIFGLFVDDDDDDTDNNYLKTPEDILH